MQHQLRDIQADVQQLNESSTTKDDFTALSGAVQGQTTAVQSSEAAVTARLDDLSRQLAELQARLADTNYRLAELAQELSATNEELKSSRARPRSANPGADRHDSGESGQPADPQALYQSAYNDYLRGNYDLAIVTFRQYLDLFPDTDLADNASYWIGECYFNKGEYDHAVREFEALVERYPRSDKRASALLKTGYAQLELGNREQGLDRLRRVVREFPLSDEANLAAQRIRSLGGNGD